MTGSLGALEENRQVAMGPTILLVWSSPAPSLAHP
jgi:hypothetical protein